MRSLLLGMSLGLLSLCTWATPCSFHGLTPADGRGGLANPERGWRFEIGIGRLEEDPVKFTHITDQWPFRRFAQDGVTIAQAYCYLTQFHDKPISEAKIEALEKDFARARAEGVKFLLRFAYEFSDEISWRTKECPTAERILAHIEQLKPVVRRNIDVIYCLQTGWVGLWGEFHSSARGIEKDPDSVAKIVQATLDMLPPGRKTMMRRVAYKENVLRKLGAEGEATAANAWSDAPTARIGFFNDGTLANWWDGGTFTEEPYADGGNREYERVHREGLYSPVDGELFWTGQDSHPVFACGMRAIDRFSYQRYTTFSLVHGHSLLDPNPKPWTIDGWKQTPVTADELKFFGIDYDAAYFEGVPHRTAYEFIRDHLGYRLALKKAEVTAVSATERALKVTLHNYGFAPPVNPRYLHVVQADGKRTEEWNTGFDCRRLLPGEDIEVTTRFPALGAGEPRIALWLPDAAASLRYRGDYAVRLATRMPTEIADGRLLHYLEAAAEEVKIADFDWKTGTTVVTNATAATEYRRLDCRWKLSIDDDVWSEGSCDLPILTPGASLSFKVPFRKLPPAFAPVGYGKKCLVLRILDNGRELATRQFVPRGKPQVFPPTPERLRHDGDILSKPYLQNAGTRAFTVCLETSRFMPGLKLACRLRAAGRESAPREVEFRFRKAEFSGTYLATARVDGLLPGTTVDYEVAEQKGTFTTWKETTDDFKCAIFGDFQSGLSNGMKWWDWEADPFLCGERMFEDMAKCGCEFAVGTGDVADTGDYRKELRPLVIERTCGVLGSKMPFFMAFGNHDSLHPENHFFFENPSPASFSFFKNGCLFVCIDDKEVGDDKHPGSVRLREWFEALMTTKAAREAKFRFVFQHVPVYVEAFGNCNRWLADLFEKHGVDCVFSGDHHGYERIVRGKLRQVVNGCMGYFDHGKPDAKLLVNWYGEETKAGGHVGLPGRTWRFQTPGQIGVLGPATPVHEGLLPGYATLEVKGDTATWTLIGFNADGSKIGPVDSFTMKSGERPNAPKGRALERYCYGRSPSGKWLLKYTLTGKGGRIYEVCEDDEWCSSRPIVEEDVVGVEFTNAAGQRKIHRLLPDNSIRSN